LEIIRKRSEEILWNYFRKEEGNLDEMLALSSINFCLTESNEGLKAATVSMQEAFKFYTTVKNGKLLGLEHDQKMFSIRSRPDCQDFCAWQSYSACFLLLSFWFCLQIQRMAFIFVVVRAPLA